MQSFYHFAFWFMTIGSSFGRLKTTRLLNSGEYVKGSVSLRSECSGMGSFVTIGVRLTGPSYRIVITKICTPDLSNIFQDQPFCTDMCSRLLLPRSDLALITH